MESLGNLSTPPYESSEEIARLMANALIMCPDLICPFLEANSGIFSWREIAFLKCLSKIITLDEFLDIVAQKTETDYELAIFKKQWEICIAHVEAQKNKGESLNF